MPGPGRPKKVLKYKDNPENLRTLKSLWGVPEFQTSEKEKSQGSSSQPTSTNFETGISEKSQATSSEAGEITSNNSEDCEKSHDRQTSISSDEDLVILNDKTSNKESLGDEEIQGTVSSQTVSSSSASSQPQGKKRKFVNSWKSQYEFLEFCEQENVMYCKICRKKEGKTFKKSSHFFVRGTSNFQISAIKAHQISSFHKECLAKNETVELSSEPLPSAILRLTKIHKEKLSCLFNTVYYLIVSNSSYNKFPELCQLQKKNGIDMGISYTTHYKTVPQFAEYISNVFQKETAKAILNANSFSLILDGSTDKSSSNHEITYVCILENGKPTTKFLAILRPEASDATGIEKCLNDHFETLGIPNWIQKLVSIGTDGASVYHGRHNGLIEILRRKKENKFLIGIHCMAHKTELLIKSAFKGNKDIEEVADIIKEIFSFYHKSYKKIDGIKEIADQIQENILKFGTLPQTRWMTFHFKAVKAVERNWKSLLLHLTEVFTTSKDAKTSAKAKDLSEKIASSSFIARLALMYDIYFQLGNLSQKLQKNDLLLYEAKDEVKAAVYEIRKLKMEGGVKVKSITNELLKNPNEFRGLPIKLDLENANSFLEDSANLCEKVASCLEILYETTDKIPGCTKIFDTRLWPSIGLNSKEIEDFGNQEIKEVLEFFKPILDEEEIMSLETEWTSFKRMLSSQFPMKIRNSPKDVYSLMIDKYSMRYPVLCKIFEVLSLVVPSSAEAERGFSKSNLIKSKHRMLLSSKNLDNSLRICLSKTTLEEFDPVPAMKLWLADRERRFGNRTDHLELDKELNLDDEDFEI